MDACTETILHFIRGGVPGNPSGEAAGNYNAFFGAPHSTTNLVGMKLDDIYTIQSQLLRRDPRSTAVGAYQFLRTTLKKLQAKKALPGSALFTAALQDEFALELLIGRGYKMWWRGTITDEDFAHLLSCEWASLPDPLNGGRSHYDGDSAGNHASTTLTNVYAMLDQARSLK